MKKSVNHKKRSRLKKSKLSQKAGLPWGTVVHVGKEYDAEVKMSAVFYNQDTTEAKNISDISECSAYLAKEGITWISVVGIQNTKIIESIGKQFHLHPLVMEDIANTEQRPKFEEFDDYIFFTLKNLEYNFDEKEISYEQISVILGKNYVISFQEKDSILFKSIHNRITSGISRARNKHADYLVYSLIDATVDSYYEISENLEDYIEEIEDRVLASTSGNSLVDIQKVKRDLVVLLKSIFPLREAINKVQRSESNLVEDTTHIFFNSIYDHAVHIIESVESQRDILSGLMDIYLTNISNRMNSVMKVLTIIATIFMPLSFVAGVYGMNFTSIPELGWPHGYLYFWGICFICVSLMLLLFWKKRWLK
jgi:magnesium transporter